MANYHDEGQESYSYTSTSVCCLCRSSNCRYYACRTDHSLEIGRSFAVMTLAVIVFLMACFDSSFIQQKCEDTVFYFELYYYRHEFEFYMVLLVSILGFIIIKFDFTREFYGLYISRRIVTAMFLLYVTLILPLTLDSAKRTKYEIISIGLHAYRAVENSWNWFTSKMF